MTDHVGSFWERLANLSEEIAEEHARDFAGVLRPESAEERRQRLIDGDVEDLLAAAGKAQG